MIHLETDRLILRDYVTGDFDDYCILKSDDQTMYYMQDIKLDSVESAKEDFLSDDSAIYRGHGVYGSGIPHSWENTSSKQLGYDSCQYLSLRGAGKCVRPGAAI